VTERLIRHRVVRVEEQPDGKVLLTLGREGSHDPGIIAWEGDIWYRAITTPEAT